MVQPKDVTVTVAANTSYIVWEMHVVLIALWYIDLSKNRLLQVDKRGWIIMLMYLLKTQFDMFIDDDTKL